MTLKQNRHVLRPKCTPGTFRSLISLVFHLGPAPLWQREGASIRACMDNPKGGVSPSHSIASSHLWCFPHSIFGAAELPQEKMQDFGGTLGQSHPLLSILISFSSELALRAESRGFDASRSWFDSQFCYSVIICKALKPRMLSSKMAFTIPELQALRNLWWR